MAVETPLLSNDLEQPLTRDIVEQPLGGNVQETPLARNVVEQPLARNVVETPMTNLASARAEGYGWDDINTHLAGSSVEAAQEGYSQGEIDQHLGYDTDSFHPDAKQLAAGRLADDPDTLDDIHNGDPFDLPTMRSDYAAALYDGTAKGPDDFASGVAAATLDAAHSVHGLDASNPAMNRRRMAMAQDAADGLAQTLPAQPDLVDAALHLTNGDAEPSPWVMKNLLDHWTDTGQQPVQAALAAETNPLLRETLTTPPLLPTGDPEAEAAAVVSQTMAPAVDAFIQDGIDGWKKELGEFDETDRKAIEKAIEKTGIVNPTDPRNLAEAAKDLGGLENAARVAFGAMMGPIEALGPVRLINPYATGAKAVTEVPASEAFKPVEPAPLVTAGGHEVVTGEPPDRGLVVAAKDKDNRVWIGKPGDTHGDLITSTDASGRMEPLPAEQMPPGDAEMGFIGPDGKFLNREEALRQVKSEGHPVAENDEFAKQSGELDAASYNEHGGTKAAPAAERKPLTIDPVATPSEKIQSIMDRISKAEEINARDRAEEFTGTAFHDRLMNGKGAETIPNFDELPPGKTFREHYDDAVKNGFLQHDEKTAALADGMDQGVATHSFLKSLLSDESGAVPLPSIKFRTPIAAARFAADATSRDYARALLTSHNEFAHQMFAHVADILEPHWKAISAHIGDWEQELKKGPAGNPMGTVMGQMIEYIEGRSAGVTISADHPLRSAADAIRQVEQIVDKHMRQLADEGTITYEGFIKDHMRHYWEDPARAEQSFLGSGKLGTRSGLNERSIPTYADGIARGLTPKFVNPIEGVLADLRGKIFYSHSAEMIKAARDSGALRWSMKAPGLGEGAIEHYIGRQPVPMEATVAQQAAAVKARADRNAAVAKARADVAAGTITRAQAAADIAAARAAHNPVIEKGKPSARIQTLQGNEGFVREINKWLGRGLQATPAGASIMEKLMYAKNVTTGFKLVWPAFHAVVEGIGSLASGIGQGLEEVAHGQFLRGFGNLLGSATVLPNLYMTARAGTKARLAYVRMSNDGIVQQLTAAGFRFKNPRAASLEQMGSAPGIYTSIRRGTLGRELASDVRGIFGNPQTQTNIARFNPVSVAGRTTAFAVKEAGRLMTFVTQPFFDHAIPSLKAGAAYRRMESFLDRPGNLNASPAVVSKYARQVVQDVDNRMGELNFDTVFAPAAAKQAAQIATISASWAYGSYRGFASALGLNIERMALEWNPVATSSLIGTVMTYGYANMIMQYLHTGQLPQDWKDLLNYRTGRTLQDGQPERGMIPSELKEVYDLAKVVMFAIGQPSSAFEGLTSYALAKTNPWWQGIHALMTGKDAVGKRIADTPGGWSHYLKENFSPIFWEQWQQRRKGSGISAAETILGFHEAAKYIEDPDAYLKGLEGMRAKWTKEELKRAQKENAQLENPDPTIAAPTSGGTGRGGSNAGTQQKRSGDYQPRPGDATNAQARSLDYQPRSGDATGAQARSLDYQPRPADGPPPGSGGGGGGGGGGGARGGSRSGGARSGGGRSRGNPRRGNPRRSF